MIAALDPLIGGLLSGFAAVLAVGVAYLGYRRAVKTDAATVQAGIKTDAKDSIQQVVDGQNTLIANLQHDNKSLRESVDEIRLRLERLETGSTDLRAKNVELERENRLLHAENDALKVQVEELTQRVHELEKNGPPPAG